MNRAYVYFIESGPGGPVKIGYTNDVAARMADLQGGNPVPLRLLAAVHGTQRTERFLHTVYLQGNLRGEWFARDTPGLNDLLALLGPLADRTDRVQEDWEQACPCTFLIEPELVYLGISVCLWCLAANYSPRDWKEYDFLQAKQRIDGGGGNRTRETFPTHDVARNWFPRPKPHARPAA